MNKLKILSLCAIMCVAAISTTILAQSVGASIDMSDDDPPASGTGQTYENSVYTIGWCKMRLLNKPKVAEELLKWQIINIVLPMLLLLAGGVVYNRWRQYRYGNIEFQKKK